MQPCMVLSYATYIRTPKRVQLFARRVELLQSSPLRRLFPANKTSIAFRLYSRLSMGHPFGVLATVGSTSATRLQRSPTIDNPLQVQCNMRLSLVLSLTSYVLPSYVI